MKISSFSSSSEAELVQQIFLDSLAGQPFRELFERLPGVCFFVKDAESRMLCANRLTLDRLGLKRESDIIGTSDYDYFPEHVAEAFIRDDQEVIRTGNPILGRVETWYNEQRLLVWFLTDKLPLHDRKGNVIGIMGTVQSYDDKRRMVLPVSQVEKAVDYIQSNLDSKLNTGEIAGRLDMSSRQLHRRFQEVFGMNVRDFILRTRINEATQKLELSDDALGDIAIDCGFCDQSAFTLQFRQITGLTPLQFRKRYR